MYTSIIVRACRLPLLRHWTLYDALVHAPYCMAKLQTFRDQGRGNIGLLLCKMGFKLQDCQQPYCAHPFGGSCLKPPRTAQW